MSRNDLLNNFNMYSDEVLEKLHVIANSILTPMETELTQVDFASMINQVFKENGLAERFYPEWKDRSSSDFGRFLVELFAIFSDKDMFYINHFSRESFATTANLYRSLVLKAEDAGFRVPHNSSATGDVNLIFSRGSKEFVPRGSIVLSVDKVQSLVYVNEEFTIPESSVDTSIMTTFIHGTNRVEQIFFDGYSIVIDVPNIVHRSIRLVIDEESWTEVDTFADSLESSKHFMVFTDEQGRAEIMFAAKGYGAIPEKESLCTLGFIVGGGYIGNIESHTLNLISNSQTVRNLQSFEQFTMSGGNDLLPLDTLRYVIVGNARHQNRIVVPEDAEYLSKQLAFVNKVNAEAVLDYVYVYVLPEGSRELGTSQITELEKLLYPKLLMGYNLAVASPAYVPIIMDITIYLYGTAVRSGSKVVVEQLIDEYLNPHRRGDFGDGVSISNLSSVILQRVPNVQNVVFNKLYRVGDPIDSKDIVFNASELVDIDNSTLTINLIGGI